MQQQQDFDLIMWSIMAVTKSLVVAKFYSWGAGHHRRTTRWANSPSPHTPPKKKSGKTVWIIQKIHSGS